MTISPGWAVGYFFIPIFNLFRPFTAMGELHRARASPMGWSKDDSGGIVPVWWTLWLVSNLVSRIEGRMAMAANTVPELESVTYLQLFSGALGIAVCIVAALMVSTIQKNQMAWVEPEDKR